ncbi:hypothetical protein J6525_42940 [Bradyrhizobium sp. WSM 4400]|nr:hypothetical protein [Bradyrhizobium australafricanum]
MRPGWYGWPIGGVVAAGAAIGFVGAAAASTWVGAPPAPGMCWYYTNPSKTQGFWDRCPHSCMRMVRHVPARHKTR